MRKKAIEKEDEFIGSRLKLRREMLGISQTKLAQIEDLTFQQVQKYESGKNRISASRLYRFARILHVPITYFYDGMENEPKLKNHNNNTATNNSNNYDKNNAINDSDNDDKNNNSNINNNNPEFENRKHIESDLRKLNTAFLKIGNKMLRNSVIKVAMEFASIEKNKRKENAENVAIN